MNRILSVIVFIVLASSLLHAQDVPYRVVFDLTSRDSLDQRAVMRWIREITASNPGAELEVVMYGKGYELVMPEKSTFIADVKDAIKNPHVSFKVCQVALRNNKIERSAVLADAQTVPDGIFEIMTKQHQGWGYIKVSH
jgi:intracellular sulfur oxidation DsrE/DsrF family protein